MGFEVLRAIVVSAVSWVLWKYFRQVFVSSPLDNIPGPPARSWIYGAFMVHRSCPLRFDGRIGNLKQVLDKNGWDFVQDLTDNYPGIVKLHGALGVRLKSFIDKSSPNS